MALYLKYRPQTLDQLIGQDVVKNTLLSAFNSGKLAHAYLFVGPRGTGKTSTARILAKMVNCEASRSSSPATVPCNLCSSCLSITDGSNLDLIEVDAASNRGIDDIRSLRERINLAPTSSKKKVYIIDEVHMLTTEAFNALLKTLEEPPAHALFILATTEVHKVPQTILSRVQRLDFKLASPSELMSALQAVAKGEDLKIDEDALQLIAKQAEGSFRDGVKLLDQVSSLGDHITLEQVSTELKSSQFEEIIKLLNCLAEKDAKAALLQVQKMLENGANIKELMLSVMDQMRSMVFIKNNLGEQLIKPEISPEKYQLLVGVSGKFGLTNLIQNLVVFQTAVERLKTASIASLPLELAMVEICSVEAVGKRQEAIEQNVIAGEPSLSLRGVSNNERRGNLPTSEDPHVGMYSNSTIPPQDDKSNKSSSDDVTTPGIAALQEKWTLVLDSVKPYNFSLEALLRHAKIVGVSKGSVVLEVPYSFHQRILETPKSRDLLESVLADILGEQIRISCVLGVRPNTPEELANVDVAADDEIVRIASEIFNAE